jgi:hypothetical protein
LAALLLSKNRQGATRFSVNILLILLPIRSSFDSLGAPCQSASSPPPQQFELRASSLFDSCSKSRYPWEAAALGTQAPPRERRRMTSQADRYTNGGSSNHSRPAHCGLKIAKHQAAGNILQRGHLAILTTTACTALPVAAGELHDAKQVLKPQCHYACRDFRAERGTLGR